jgi:hypothetical protein
VQVADLMQGGRTVATITPTDTGLRLVSHGRKWSKARWRDFRWVPATGAVLDRLAADARTPCS